MVAVRAAPDVLVEVLGGEILVLLGLFGLAMFLLAVLVAATVVTVMLVLALTVGGTLHSCKGTDCVIVCSAARECDLKEGEWVCVWLKSRNMEFSSFKIKALMKSDLRGSGRR